MNLLLVVAALAVLWTLTPWWIALPVTLLGLLGDW